MEILAGNVTAKVATFLHAGYISAYPRPFEPHVLPESAPVFQADLAEALRLEGQSLAWSGTAPLSERLAAALQQPSIWGTLALLGLMALGVWLFYLLMQRGRHRLVPRGLMAAAVVPLACLFIWCEPDLPENKPWEGVQVRPYVNPELATRTLQHALVADGIINMGRPIRNLANIQDEVALPVHTPSADLAYALTTYGLDGWGKEMQLTDEGGGAYTVSSAGADGTFGTSDDIELTVAQCDDQSWDNQRHAFFVRAPTASSPVVMIHRWRGDLFQYNDRQRALELTGSDLFDVLNSADFSDEQRQKLAGEYAAVGSDGLVVQVY